MEPAVVLRPHLRWLIRKDLPSVMAIEIAGGTLGWTEEQLLKTLREHNCIGLVAEVGGEVGGYFVYELRKTGIRLANFVVAPEHRRRGVGRAMVEKAKSKLFGHRRTKLLADVRETNLDALRFLRSQGFKATTVQRGFYADTGEDAFRMLFVPEGITEV